MDQKAPYRIKTITELHRVAGYAKPEHPLISVLNLDRQRNDAGIHAVIFDFYVVSLKRGCDMLFYGQQKYDFDEGVMAFMAPGQVLRGEEGEMPPDLSGWMLFIDPDFLWGTALAAKMKKYEFFDYSVNEALFLSDKEEKMVHAIVETIQNEYRSNIDRFSKEIIISHLEALFNYADRFYNRQFITREKSSHQILERLEGVLAAYFEGEDGLSKGLPTVRFIAEALHVSPSYLRGVLKALTGQSTQQHIHEKIIERAKQQLSTTSLTVSEIAYQLGFEHVQSFSKLFKTKTAQAPLAFRQLFNRRH